MRHDGSHAPTDYASAFTASFVGAFLGAVVAECAVVGNSLGGPLALHLAFSEPARVSDLVLVDSVGLGRVVNPVLVALSSPAAGELAAALAKTPPGAA
jgi:pimeloyl-ACP methyl ester carboxylesterase